MSDLEKQIEGWRKDMLAAGITRPEILNELESHLREEFQRQLSSSLSEPEAFQNAAAKLGDGKLLKREFVKAGRRPSFAVRDNPVSLNLVGAWFILVGLNAVRSLRPFFHMDFGRWFPIGLFLTLLLCVQLPIGIGLLRRRNLWRGLAVGWCWWALILYMFSELYVHFLSSQPQANPAYTSSLGTTTVGMSENHSLQYMFLGISLPFAFLQIISWLNIGMMVWAYYLLTRSRVRNLFHPEVRAVAD